MPKGQLYWEWLTRKQRRFEFTIECKEVMKNPPKLKESVFMYHVLNDLE